MGTAQASAVAIVCGRPRRAAGRPAHAERGQGRRHRQRPRRQGAGGRHGDPAPAADRARPRPADAADALGAGHLPRLARRRAGAGIAVGRLAAATADRGGVPGDRLRRRPGGGRSAPDGAVVEVGGVGLPSSARPARSPPCGSASRRSLPTSLVVREDSLTLYGFADDDERVVFELLQTASGVGPRLAQAMLAVHAPDALRRAVATEDLAALTQVPGIGRKGAQRIVLELKDRLGARPRRRHDRRPAAAVARPAGATRCTRALVGLGWSAREADEARGVGGAVRRRVAARASRRTSARCSRCALRSLSRA